MTFPFSFQFRMPTSLFEGSHTCLSPSPRFPFSDLETESPRYNLILIPTAVRGGRTRVPDTGRVRDVLSATQLER